MCYITPFKPADGHFPSHHPSSLLSFVSLLSQALLCTPSTHTSVPFLFICLSSHPSFLPSAPLGPADCVGIDFTLLMFITSSPSVPSQCTWAAKPPNICRVFRRTSHPGYQGATVVTFVFLICCINTDLLHWPSFSDGELYAGTSADFMGRDFAIFRTLGKHHPIRTEQHDSRWLNGERFLEMLVHCS